MKNNNISSSSFGSPTNNVLSSKAVIFAVLVIFLSCIRDCNCVWESLVFLIADDRGGPLNVKCSQFSSYTCLYGYLVDERVREHTWDDRYNQVFQILIQNYYKRINWFSMDDSELGSCCAFQTEMYELNGRMMGMSPAEYYHRIMDFRVNNKRLNYLKIHNSSSCGVFISAIGYGVGPLKVVSQFAIRDDDLLIMRVADGLPYDGHYKFRNVEELGTTGHFDWFKTWYVCKEQPWICAEID
ncbi:uncharacterized protein LOC142349576 isoform X2 [Convolutriloba macropyga]|uniref:uncharacterized protein LOC142349576 isoform X2 n=1 Tax=Convolutriloba macropyga TaxID=536237 RepID=UPI003F5252DB